MMALRLRRLGRRPTGLVKLPRLYINFMGSFRSLVFCSRISVFNFLSSEVVVSEAEVVVSEAVVEATEEVGVAAVMLDMLARALLTADPAFQLSRCPLPFLLPSSPSHHLRFASAVVYLVIFRDFVGLTSQAGVHRSPKKYIWGFIFYKLF